MRYVIHIGPPKTGTTYLQYCFTTLKDALRADGIYYPTEFWSPAPAFGHHGMATALMQRDANLTPIFNSFATSGADTVLLSCEGFASLHKASLEHLRDLIGDAEIQIVYASRRWSDGIPSQWKQDIRQGGVATFPEKYARTLAAAHGYPGINFKLTLDLFADVFGHSAIKIIPYSTLMDERRDIFEFFNTNILGWSAPDGARLQTEVHRSLSLERTELIRCLNVMERQRCGTSGIQTLHAFQAIHDEMQQDIERITAAMDHAEMEVSDVAVPLLPIFDAIQRDYGARIIGSDLIFTRRKRMVPYVRQDYLITPGIGDALHRLHAAVAERNTPTAAAA